MGTVERLNERIGDWREDSRVDRARRQVRNVALTGRNSRNGYTYTEAALREAVGLYEGRPVFLDHAANISRPLERSARDLVGSIANVRYEAGRIRGDIDVLDTESGRTFLALAEGNSASVGMSHVVLAARSADKQIVERIEEVISVDAVVFPATTLTLREQWEAAAPAEPVPGSWEAELSRLDALLADLPGSPRRVATREGSVLIVTRAGEGETGETWECLAWERDASRGPLLTGESEPLEADAGALVDWSGPAEDGPRERADGAVLESLRRRYRRLLRRHAAVCRLRENGERGERLLRESRLPAEAVTPEFRQLVLSLDERSQRELVTERSRWWLGRDRRPPESRGRAEVQAGVEEARFIRAIKR